MWDMRDQFLRNSFFLLGPFNNVEDFSVTLLLRNDSPDRRDACPTDWVSAYKYALMETVHSGIT
jgi:hypothetical protein